MKKLIIGSLVGAVIMFVWSFFAWVISPLHLHTYMYTPAQDTLLKAMADNALETGVYIMPTADNRNIKGMDENYKKECENLMNENKGKPMATIYYVKEGMEMGGGTMARGFLFYFIAVFAACILLAPAFATTLTFFGRWWLVLMVGVLITACGPLLSYNWMGVPWGFTLDMILDIFLSWGITGLWLAWYFRK